MSNASEDRPAVVAVCPACGNYPYVAVPERDGLEADMADIIYYLLNGFTLTTIHATDEERKKFLACQCPVGAG